MTFQVRIGTFRTGLRVRFRHAAADRSETDNVLVEVRDADGRAGYGEGCPRAYVTAETRETAAAFLVEHAASCAQAASDVGGLAAWTHANAALIDQSPAAFCALELALLDVLARRDAVPVETLLGVRPLTDSVAYTAVLGAASGLKMRAQIAAYRLWGMGDFKVKIDGRLSADRARVSAVPGKSRLRLDANNAFADADAAIAHVRALDRDVWAVEEPLAPGDVAGMAKVAEALDARIILDESLTRLDQLAPYAERPGLWIANIRVSKCGGVRRALRLAQACQTAGIQTILGAQVGETSLLTRAALTVGQAMASPPLAREGGYGRILLKDDLVTPSVRFGLEGRLDPRRFKLDTRPGLGLDVNASAIDWMD